MQTLRRPVGFLIVFLFCASTALADQKHVVPSDQLATAVSAHVAAQDADRATIHTALTQPQVRTVAASMGIDVTRASRAVETMSGADLKQAANAARQVNEQLVGGASTVTLSTTTIILVLLIIILIVVVAD